MAKNLMPVGNKSYFEGEIRKLSPEAFGFFFCKITAPDFLNHPILQLHVKTKSGLRTLAPVGSFEGLIFPEEMRNALKFGYKFEILWGYTFEKKYIFKDYVDTLYQLRLEYPKDHPMNYIAKLFLNSLYGRFGMKYLFDVIRLVDKKEFLKCTSFVNGQVDPTLKHKNIIDLKDKMLLVLENQFNVADSETKEYNINIAIASAVTSYARIVMSQFKNNPSFKLFYTDTDSIYTNLNPDQLNSLIPNTVDNKLLGKLKLESVSNKAIFISPKCYALESVEGDFNFQVKGLIKKVPVTLNDF